MSGHDPETGAAAPQRLPLESPPASEDLLKTLGALASEHGSTIRDASDSPLPPAQAEQTPAPSPRPTARRRKSTKVAPPAQEAVPEELHEPLQGWWELDKATHRTLYGPIAEVVDGDFRSRVAEIGATSLVHLLSFGRSVVSWSDPRAVSGKTRRQFEWHIDQISPYPWREAPTFQDIARMCRTLDDVWAACLLVFNSRGQRIRPVLVGPPPNVFGRQTFVRHNRSAVTLGDVERNNALLPLLLQQADRQPHLPELQNRARVLMAGFRPLQGAVGAPVPGLGRRPPSSAKE